MKTNVRQSPIQTFLLAAALLALPDMVPISFAQAGMSLTTLHSFYDVFPNGSNPQARLVQGSDGYFYGTTESGGAHGVGTVFRISTNGALTSLYSFTGGNDGANPECRWCRGSDGV